MGGGKVSFSGGLYSGRDLHLTGLNISAPAGLLPQKAHHLPSLGWISHSSKSTESLCPRESSLTSQPHSSLTHCSLIEVSSLVL